MPSALPRLSRRLVAIAALLLAGAFLFPLWRITLVAPQYPEGIGMRIRVTTVEGAKPNDLHNINGLNHYIGMHPIEPDDIPELRFMPWILGALVASGLGVAASGRRRPLVAWLAAFLAVGTAGLLDFWKWGYQYGHELDEHAIIQIPGMAYQPPLLGTKQLLNFTAQSWPDSGGILAGLAFVLGVVAFGCAPSRPRTIAYDHDTCDYCRMTISDPRFGAVAETETGRSYVFDSIECLASFVAEHDARELHGAWVSDWNRPGTLIPVDSAMFHTRIGAAGSPMGKGLVATRASEEPKDIPSPGPAQHWTEVVASLRAEVAHAH